MPLTPDEQHALRQIEGQLAADDPTLVVYLAGRVSCRRPGIRLFAMYLVAPLLIGLDVGAHLLAPTVAGMLLVPATPALSRHLRGRAGRRRQAMGVTHNRRIRLDDIDDLAAADRWTRLLVVVWG